MPTAQLARSERTGLCDLLNELGPEAATPVVAPLAVTPVGPLAARPTSYPPLVQRWGRKH